MDTVKIEMNALEEERREVIRIYKRQLEAFRYIKKDIEKAQWDDERYNDMIESMNIISSAISAALQTLTNGNDVFVISDLIPVAEKYLEYEKKFPRLN